MNNHITKNMRTPYSVRHPISRKHVYVQSRDRVDFIASFWAGKFKKSVDVYTKWGYYTIHPGGKG